MEPQDSQTPGQNYPGGEDYAPYRWAFQLWILAFLTIICVGLMTYLGGFL
ncbi:MAG: hypothetical protein ACRCZF_14385 [Gemmataceae bacterium]